MFDFDAGKLLIIGVVALIVIGPKELPRVLRQVGQTVGKLRRMATEFQGQFMDAMKEADIQNIKDEVEKLSRESAVDVNFDPARDIQAELTRSINVGPPAEPAALMVETASPTAGFALPPTEPVTSDAETPAGTAPLAEAVEAHATGEPTSHGEPSRGDAAEAAPVSLGFNAGRKRKIIQSKRRLPRLGQPHDVSDRTRVVSRVRMRAMEP